MKNKAVRKDLTVSDYADNDPLNVSVYTTTAHKAP